MTLAPYSSTLSVLLNEHGGIIDDTMITKHSDDAFYVVTNAGTRDKDLAWFRDKLATWNASERAKEGPVEHEVLENWGLIALQGAVMCLSSCPCIALCPLCTRDTRAIPIRSPGCTILAGTYLFRPQRLDVWKVRLCPYRRVQSPRGTRWLHWRRRFRGKGRMYIRSE